MATPKDWTHIAVPNSTKELLKALGGSRAFSYAKIIEYLMVKAGHLDKSEADISYDLMDHYINGGHDE